MGFWSPSVLVRDAARHGVQLLRVDIARSQERRRVRGNRIRLGLCYLHAWGPRSIAHFLACRATAPYRDLHDLCRRTQLPRRLIEQLIRAGGCDGWGQQRRHLLWELGTLHYDEAELDLSYEPEAVNLPALSRMERLQMEQAALGLAVDDHVMAILRERLAEDVLSSRELARLQGRQPVRVAGAVAAHQAPPTAHGIHFVTLEEEWGMIDVIVRPNLVEQYRELLHIGQVVLVEGPVQHADGVVNVLAVHIAPLASV